MTTIKQLMLVAVLAVGALASVGSVASAHECSGAIGPDGEQTTGSTTETGTGGSDHRVAHSAANDAVGRCHFAGDGISNESGLVGDDLSETNTLIIDHAGENLTTALTIFAYILAFGIAITLLVIGIRRVIERIYMLVGSG